MGSSYVFKDRTKEKRETMSIKKLFGGIDLTWKKLILCAVAAGVFTAVMAIIPGAYNTSFGTITATFEVWVLFGILIIMNSRSNLDAALKCFVFFLISQPLVYLLQVPFSWQGWGLFQYYPYWFIWTVLCFPMGYVGYYMKKGKWWGYLILLPMILLVADSYYGYLPDFQFSYPRYALICLFCVVTMFLYPLAIFDSRRIKTAGVIVSGVLVAAITVACLLHPPVYSTTLLSSSGEFFFDDTYQVSLADSRYGEVRIEYSKELEDYAVQAEFKRAGHTTLILESPDGEKKEFDVTIERTTYEVTEK